jgi:hypothetical protein
MPVFEGAFLAGLYRWLESVFPIVFMVYRGRGELPDIAGGVHLSFQGSICPESETVLCLYVFPVYDE